MREFAQELVDLVIDEVATARPDTKDVGACGRVCRRWLLRSRMHLFSRIRIRLSRADPAAIQSFLDIVDASLVHILSFVRSLDVRLVNGEVSEEQVARLRNCGTLTQLRIQPENAVLKEDRLRFQHLLHTHTWRFGACPSLTQFELGFPSDIELCVIADLISTVPVTDAFPPHLHTMDISMNGGGTSLFFEWLLSHSKPPIFTSLTLAGCARGESIAPIEAYLLRHGPAIESLSLHYWMVDFRETETFEMRALASTPRLVNLSLTGQCPKTVLTTLMLLPSIHLVSLEISVPLFGRADCAVSFTHPSLKTSLTPEIRALMPQASAREILAHE
ncbi:hypothetical protein FB451DRAFT_1297728 [Mycena latifolia]|nr:hypothetical protein FB451DRAFT_1297728 [Mycena latifolia]